MKSASRARVTMYMFSALILLVMVGLYAYLYRGIGAHVDRVIVAHQTLSVEGRDQVEQKNLVAISETTATSRARLVELFVPTEDAVDFIQEIESVGSISGTTVTISSIAVDPADPGDPGQIGKITAGVAVTGSWTGVIRALELFETLPFRSSIDKVSLDTSVISGEKGQPPHAWSMTLGITASTISGMKRSSENPTTTPQ